MLLSEMIKWVAWFVFASWGLCTKVQLREMIKLPGVMSTFSKSVNYEYMQL